VSPRSTTTDPRDGTQAADAGLRRASGCGSGLGTSRRSAMAPLLDPRADTGPLPRACQLALVALVAYVPQLLAQPGKVSSDTKTYLYLDVGRFLRQSASMWDPTVGLGTVTHQQIGYLLPMGPFFWVFHQLGVPLWVAQRLWVGSILFAAGAGVLFLARLLGPGGLGAPVAAFAYMVSPYFLQYVGRISVLLLPWAGLPWLLAFTVLALRRGGWRDVARFGVVIALVGSINATSLLYVCVGPVLWLAYAVAGLGESTWRRAGGVVVKLAAVSLAVSAWWIAGLAVEAGFGVDILRTTETVQTVSQTSTPIEVLRGLGYWYFYGTDRLGAWVVTSVQLTQQLVPLALGFAVPVAAFASAIAVRWRHRAFFVLLALVGLVLAVGVYPFADPTWFGHALEAFMTRTTAGLALRSTDRATPLVTLGLAMLLGAGVAAAASRARPAGIGAAAVVVALVAGANPAAWDGNTVADKYTQPASPPPYTLAAARALDAHDPGTRVLGIPGSDFADYVYGDTTDPVYPALLTDRGYVSRQQVPQGSQATADLLYAIDDPIQVGTADWQALAPLARLMSVGDVLLQSDLDYAHYDQPSPRQLWAQLSTAPAGLGAPACFGTPRPNPPRIPRLDEASLALPPNAPWPCPLEVFPVANPRPVVRAEPTAAPLVVDGDGEGLVEAAGLGLLTHDPTVLYAGTLDRHPRELAAALRSGATVVVTDTNRKRAFRWDTIVDEAGQTLTAAQHQPTDPANAPLDLFPGAPPSAATTASYLGVASVTASDYGDTVTYLPEQRPAMAIDGNLGTAWEVGAFGQPVGQWWQVRFLRPVTAGAVNLVQPLTGAPNRWITRATLTFDGRHPVTVRLGPSSRTAAGQTITFRTRTFRTLRIRIDATNMPGAGPVAGPSSVGLAEVRVAGARATELIDLPSDLLAGHGAALANDRLVVVMTRQRVAPFPPRQDPETSLARSFVLPATRTFTLTGTARINALVPDDVIDRLVGRQQASGIVAYSKGRLPGDLRATASAALDGNPATAWSPGFGASSQVGSWVHVDLPKPVTFDHLDLQVVADRRHSVPTSLTIATENGSATVTLPPIAASSRPGSTATVPVRFPALTGRHLTVTFTGVHLRFTRNYYSRQLIALPIGIAELGIPGVTDPPPPAQVPSSCRDDLLTVDGKPVWAAVSGTSAAALAGAGMAVRLCGPDAGGLTLGPGRHVVQAADGHRTGWNLDQLVLDSAPGGTAQADPVPGTLSSPPVPGPAPKVRVLSQTATSLHLRLSGVPLRGPAFDLVLGESINPGWSAAVDGGPSFGRPQLIDGFANGWRVDPGAVANEVHGGVLDVTLTWTPQRWIWAALGLSAAALLGAAAAGFLPTIERRRRGAHRAGTGRATPAGPGAAPPELASPLGSSAPGLPLTTAAAAAVATGAVLAALTRPWIGAAVGAAAGASLLHHRARWLLTGSAVGLLAAAGALVVAGQAMDPRIPGGTWPPSFPTAATLAWAAMACLAADAVTEVVRLRSRRAASRTTTAPPPGGGAADGPTPPPG